MIDRVSRPARVMAAAGALGAAVLVSPVAQAGSMRCGGDIISDGQRVAQTQTEIVYKCGEPYARNYSTWLYVQSDGSVYRLHFNDNGELDTIKLEIVRR